DYALHQNHPNPFNTHTTIDYQLPKTSEVELSVFNLLGQKLTVLVSGSQPPGRYEIEWDATGIEGGVYFYKLSTDNGFVQTKKLILLK
ncbi:MAG: T9SS type A sorting domain-containing protein, partial [candidate division WOR-3 bacterium]